MLRRGDYTVYLVKEGNVVEFGDACRVELQCGSVTHGDGIEWRRPRLWPRVMDYGEPRWCFQAVPVRVKS